MGVIVDWQQDVFSALAALDKKDNLKWDKTLQVIEFGEKTAIHLVPLQTKFTPDDLLERQTTYQQEGKLLVQLWEDVWLARKKQVLNRISSFIGLNKTLHARKGKIEEIDLKVTTDFLNAYHLQGFVKAKYNYGFYIDSVLFAVASFSAARPMKQKGANYMSAELVRFASKEGFTITGGLSKFIKHFVKQVKVNDIMSYADRDWSLGKGYDQLGFQLTDITTPAYLYAGETDKNKSHANEKNLIRYFPHRLPKAILLGFNAQNELDLDNYTAKNGFIKLFNTGNLKYHLYL